MLLRLVRLSSISLPLLCIGLAAGQDYPTKPIRLVTPQAGGGADFSSRLIAQAIAAPLGQPVLVENRASGVIAAEVVSKAQPDGYTIFVGGDSTWISQLLRKTPYDVRVDFSPISLIDKAPSVLAVNSSVSVKSVQELIALAKAKPGTLNYSSASAGTPSHLSGELLKSMAGVNIVWVPYKGSAPAITALVSGEVQLTFGSITSITPHVKSGALRALAVTSAQPSALFPGLPTVAASGLPGYESEGITAALVPVKTPGAVINRINQEIVRFLGRPEVKERFLSAGVEPVGSSPGELSTIINRNMVNMGKLIKSAGITAD